MRVVTVLSTLIFSSMLPAQGASATRMGGLVRGPSGDPLADAEVHFYPAVASDYPWLDRVLTLPDPVAAICDRRGHFTITCSAARGSLWIEHHDGLGCLRHGLGPGVSEVLSTAPPGELHLGSGKTFIAEIGALLANGERVYLGSRRGTALRLPEGSYLMLIEDEGHRQEIALRIRSGERRVIDLRPPTRQEVRGWQPNDGAIYLDGWPRSLRTEAGRMLLPQPRTRSLLRWHRRLRDASYIEELWYRPSEIIRLHSPNLHYRQAKVIDDSGHPLAGARVCVVTRAVAGMRVESMAIADAKGIVDLASAEERGEGYMIALVPGYGPAVQLDGDGDAPITLRSPPASHVHLRILDAHGQPLAETRVELRQQPQHLLHRISYSNLRGEVRFEDLPEGPAQLRIDHPDFLVREQSLLIQLKDSTAFHSIRLEPGLELPGQVVDEQGLAVPGAVVELRSAGQPSLGLKKTLATDASGRFCFRGLPDVHFIVFVQTIVKGITWSGRATDLPAGETNLQIVVRPEDPRLPHKK